MFLSFQGNLNQAEADLREGKRLEQQRQEGCVDLFYRAAIQAWDALEEAPCPLAADPNYSSAWRIYQESLAGLIPAASRFGRLDPRGRMIVNSRDGRRVIPITYYGFAWKPSDFCRVAPASDFQGRELQHHYRAPGLGLSLVATRLACREEPFFCPVQPFPVTAVLRPTRQASEASLEFYNPCLFDSLRLGSAVAPMERDLSAPFVQVAQETPRIYLQGFLDPAEADVQPKLLMMEPYQRGKIPVVFIHGLLSDPITWLEAVNELRAHPDLYRRYQFWYFRYPTGGVVLESAAKLREQLLLARETFDPACRDQAMARTVLIGHSMGGLIARLQATYSSDILWRHVARQPLESVRAGPGMRDRLERDFFFDPSPQVNRIVFIGTPHRGATMARRMMGRVASNLVRPFGADEPKYRQLMDQNPDVFYEEFQKSPPTTIDLLEPSNPLLEALAQMPFRPGVRLHSIIGTGGSMLGEPGDGVVPVSSARQAGVRSELLVPARHMTLHQDAATIAELRRILGEHARESGE